VALDERAKDFGPVKRAPSAVKASKKGKTSGVQMNVHMVPQGSAPEVQPNEAEFANMDDYLSKCAGLCDVVGMIKVRPCVHPRGRINTVSCSPEASSCPDPVYDESLPCRESVRRRGCALMIIPLMVCGVLLAAKRFECII
jgi:hypothetical protein